MSLLVIHHGEGSCEVLLVLWPGARGFVEQLHLRHEVWKALG